MKEVRPSRGSHALGSFGHYNNWDFKSATEADFGGGAEKLLVHM